MTTKQLLNKCSKLVNVIKMCQQDLKNWKMDICLSSVICLIFGMMAIWNSISETFLKLCFTSSQVIVPAILFFPFVTIWTCGWVKYLVNTLKSNKNPVNTPAFGEKPIIRLVAWILCIGALKLQSTDLLWPSTYTCAKLLEKTKQVLIRFKIQVHKFHSFIKED